MNIEERINKIYSISPYSKESLNETKFSPSIVGSPVYGEVMYEGTKAIVDKFSNHFNKDTVFYDLGSGLGKMVLHIGMKYGVKKSIGIEYSKERCDTSKKIKEDYAKDFNSITFHCGNVLDQDLSNATVVYMDNTVFPEHINNKIYGQLPKGCLILYKKPYSSKFEGEGFDLKKQNFEKNLVKRTYNQNSLYWYIK